MSIFLSDYEETCQFCESRLDDASFYVPYGSTIAWINESECCNPHCPGEHHACPICLEMPGCTGKLDFDAKWTCQDCGREYEPGNLPNPLDEWEEEDWAAECKRRGLPWEDAA